jgi:zinc protease
MKSWIACASLGSALALALLAQQPAPARRPPAKAVAKAPVKPEETASLESTLGLKLGPPRPLRPQKDDQSTLSNGVRLLISENHELPVINIHVFVPAGSVSDPAGKAGLAEATAAIVRTGGTNSLTASALPDRLAELGVVIDSRATESRAQFWLQVPRYAFAEAAPIFRDLLVSPRLDPEALDTALGRMHEDIGQRSRNPVAGVVRIFRGRLYAPGSPFGRLPDYDSLDNIARADIEAFHRQYYAPQQAVIVVEGDITPSDARAKIQELFGSWKTTQPGTPPTVEQPKPTQSALLFADRDDVRVATFVLGHLGGRITDPDYPAMLLISDLLTTGTAARLPARVRAAGGWRAEWSASWEAGFERPGEFMIGAIVDPPFITQSIRIVKDELAKLREGVITDQELESARTHLLMQLALRYQASEDQARDRGAALFHGQPPDVLEQAFQGIVTLTKADVVRAAAKNLQTEQLVAVVGPSGLFDKPLSSISANVEAVDWKVQPARPMRPKTDAASIERGREMLARMQEAMGGRAKLEAIRDISVVQEGTTLLGERIENIKLTERWMHGGVYRQDQDYGGLNQVVFYNGKIAWIGRKGVVAPLPPGAVALVRTELFRLPFRLALSDKDPERQVADLGGNVLQITEGDAHGVRIYLDASTWLPQRLLYRVTLGEGASMAVEETLSDWKDFGGIKWPGKIATRKNGRRADDMTVSEAKFNTGLTAADMEKKP